MGNLKEPHAYLPDTCITNRDVPKLNENTALVHLYPFAPVGHKTTCCHFSDRVQRLSQLVRILAFWASARGKGLCLGIARWFVTLIDWLLQSILHSIWHSLWHTGFILFLTFYLPYLWTLHRTFYPPWNLTYYLHISDFLSDTKLDRYSHIWNDIFRDIPSAMVSGSDILKLNWQSLGPASPGECGQPRLQAKAGRSRRTSSRGEEVKSRTRRNKLS